MVPSRNESAEAGARMRALLKRWQQSLELHERYLTLDDAHYWHVQPWPTHERPVAWIVKLAREKVAELTRSLEQRLARKDADFAAGLEQMLFLANLVGLQPAGRYIPLADPNTEQADMLPARPATPELPRPRLNRAARPARAPALNPEIRQIMDDAVRLLKWGRQWHELGELISRLAGRPSVGEVRRALRTHRARIEATAGTSAQR
jgi:hypothetical protein